MFACMCGSMAMGLCRRELTPTVLLVYGSMPSLEMDCVEIKYAWPRSASGRAGASGRRFVVTECTRPSRSMATFKD